MNYLTSLRGLAAILVVFYHIKHFLPADIPLLSAMIKNGYVAVDFFFVLSGFILAYNYADRFQNFKRVDYSHFILKRIARIYPLHLFMVVTFAIIPLLLIGTGRDVDAHRFGLDALLAKVFLVDVWGLGYEFTWNVPSWSISAEFAAYIAFPFLAFVAGRIHKSGMVVVFLGLAASLGALFYFSGASNIGDNIETLGALRCAFEFSMGIGVFYLKRYFPQVQGNFARCVLLFACAVYAVGAYSAWYDYLYAPICFALVILGVTGFSGLLHKMLEQKTVAYLGEISYSIYLTHYFVRDFLTMALLDNNEAAGPGWIVLYLAVTLVLSMATYRFVEMPGRLFIVKKFVGEKIKKP